MLTEKKLISIIQDVIKKGGKNITIKSSSFNLEAWDSLNHLNILERLDKATKGKAGKIADLATATSVKLIMKILKKKKLLKE